MYYNYIHEIQVYTRKENKYNYMKLKSEKAEKMTEQANLYTKAKLDLQSRERWL